MADTYTLPALTAADINSIVTAGQDGTYNITYTNLTANQIQQIGDAFETAMQTNLKSVALSGEYSDLIGAPSLPNSALETIEHEPDEEHQEAWTSQEVKEFSDVAFSGKASDLNNMDDNNEDVFLTRAAFNSTEASKISNGKINEWNNKSDFDGSTLSDLAFSGNYKDLQDPFYSIKFCDFIYLKNNNIFEQLSNEQYEFMQRCGLQSGWQTNIDKLYNSDSNDGVNLKDELQTLITNFNSGKICYIKIKLNNNIEQYYLITNIQTGYDNTNSILQNIIISCVFVLNNNYNYELMQLNASTEEQRMHVLNSIIDELYNISIIVDLQNNILYSKNKRVFPPMVIENTGIGVRATDGSIGLILSNKTANILQIINSPEENYGLYASIE